MEVDPGNVPAPIPESSNETPSEFYMRLQTAINQRREIIENTELPRLKESFRVFHVSYQSLYKVLLRKGLIDEDPYKHEQKISEIAAPSNSPFLESERDTQMSVRMSEFDSQLDFLNHYYQFSLEFMTLKRVKNLVALASYVRWSELSLTSENTTTRVLAELLEKIKKGGDQLSVSILSDSHDQLAKIQRTVLSMLKTVAQFQREAYKLALRKDIMPDVNLPASPFTHMEEAVKAVKKAYVQNGPPIPFYPELVQELIQEDHAPNADLRRAEVIRKISVMEKKSGKPKKNDDRRRILVDGLRILSNSARSLSECLVKLQDNSIVLENRRITISERIRRWFMRAMGHKERKQSYEVKYNDIATSAVQRETIEFVDFCHLVDRKSRLFSGILLRTGTVAKRVETASEDQLFSFLTRHIGETQLIFRRLQSLDTFFKEAVSERELQLMRGIKIELTNVKNHIIKANQKKHEFLAHREEADQLRKLGIAESDSPIA